MYIEIKKDIHGRPFFKNVKGKYLFYYMPIAEEVEAGWCIGDVLFDVLKDDKFETLGVYAKGVGTWCDPLTVSSWMDGSDLTKFVDIALQTKTVRSLEAQFQNFICQRSKCSLSSVIRENISGNTNVLW